MRTRRDHWRVVVHNLDDLLHEPVISCHTGTVGSQRFLTLADVADILNVSSSQAYALVRGGDIPAIKVGGRGQWRVERAELERYIERMYADVRGFVATNPLNEAELAADELSDAELG